MAQKGANHPLDVRSVIYLSIFTLDLFLIFSFQIFRTPDRGWGVRSFSTIPAGSFISEYTGELIGDDVANDREDKYLFETIMVGECILQRMIVIV